MTPEASQISQWLRDARDRAKLARRAASVHLDVTERTIQRWEDPEDESLPPADQLFALVRFYKAERQMLVLLGNWEKKKGSTKAEGGEGRRRKAAGE